MSSPFLHDTSTTATTTARTYYDSSDADTFYRTIWGGSDIHIGLYESPSDSIATASQRTVTHMASLIAPITASTRILDMGAGYGGAARYLAKTYGCKVTCVNISEVENERNREMTREAGLEGLVKVVEGSFENVPCVMDVFDIVWSQDAFLHSGNRAAVVREIRRVVKEGGRVIFTDPMAVWDPNSKGHSATLAPILRRLNLESLGDYWSYVSDFEDSGFSDPIFEDHTDQMVTHYRRVLEELESHEAQLKRKISDEYVESMKEFKVHLAKLEEQKVATCEQEEEVGQQAKETSYKQLKESREKKVEEGRLRKAQSDDGFDTDPEMPELEEGNTRPSSTAQHPKPSDNYEHNCFLIRARPHSTSPPRSAIPNQISPFNMNNYGDEYSEIAELKHRLGWKNCRELGKFHDHLGTDTWYYYVYGERGSTGPKNEVASLVCNNKQIRGDVAVIRSGRGGSAYPECFTKEELAAAVEWYKTHDWEKVFVERENSRILGVIGYGEREEAIPHFYANSTSQGFTYSLMAPRYD